MDTSTTFIITLILLVVLIVLVIIVAVRNNAPVGPQVGSTCVSTPECDYGLRCEGGRCVIPEQGSCKTTADCAAGLQCVANVCTAPVNVVGVVAPPSTSTWTGTEATNGWAGLGSGTYDAGANGWITNTVQRNGNTSRVSNPVRRNGSRSNSRTGRLVSSLRNEDEWGGRRRRVPDEDECDDDDGMYVIKSRR